MKRVSCLWVIFTAAFAAICLSIILAALSSLSCSADTVVSSATFDEAEPGDTVTLSSSVRNLGEERLGQGCSVWFRVQGPGDLDQWAGFADCSNQPDGTRRKYWVEWVVPKSAQAGTYSYWSVVYLNRSNQYSSISARSGLNYFLVVRGTAQAYDIDRLGDAVPGRNLTLSARVKETSDIDVDSGCEAWFEVTYPDGSRQWAGHVSCYDISSGSTKRYRTVWMVPMNAASGRYYYRVRVFQRVGDDYVSVSEYSEPSYFNVERGSAQIIDEGAASNCALGGNVTLSARVKSSGDVSIRAGCEVWFKVTGPGGFDDWVAHASCSNLSEGSTQWYKAIWNVPLSAGAGGYSYRSRVYQNAGSDYVSLSGYSDSESFTVYGNRAQISSIRKPAGASAGGNITLSVGVRNLGGYPLSPDCVVWFWVKGPNTDNWAASAKCTGQERYSTKDYPVTWQVPSGAKNVSYSYWARVYEYDGRSYYAISEKSDAASFQVK